MIRKFHLNLSTDDLEGRLEDVIANLQTLAEHHGKDKRIHLEIGEDRGTFDTFRYIDVSLEEE